MRFPTHASTTTRGLPPRRATQCLPESVTRESGFRWFSISRGLLRRSQIAQQPFERALVLVVMLPTREVSDVPLPSDLRRPRLGRVHHGSIEAHSRRINRARPRHRASRSSAPAAAGRVYPARHRWARSRRPCLRPSQTITGSSASWARVAWRRSTWRTTSRHNRQVALKVMKSEIVADRRRRPVRQGNPDDCEPQASAHPAALRFRLGRRRAVLRDAVHRRRVAAGADPPRRGPCLSARHVRILREVADGLAYAHAKEVVHRDIKPDNVLLSGSPRVSRGLRHRPGARAVEPRKSGR